MALSVIVLSDVNGSPRAKLELPSGLRVGDPIALKFNLQRSQAGRTEVLEVDHKFRVTAVGIDATSWPSKQLLSLDSVEKAPTWRAIKKRPERARSLGPARFPRTPVK